MGVDSIRVEPGKRSYDVVVAGGSLPELGERLNWLAPGRNIAGTSKPPWRG